MKYEAYLFDLNGTIIDDMQFHAIAWREILNDDLGQNLTHEDVVRQMYGKNSELLERVFGKGYFTDEKINELSLEKERRYQKAYKPHLRLIEGLGQFLDDAQKAGIKMAIGSAAIPFNIDFVLDNLNLRKYFNVIVSADDVALSKPNPDTFTKAADALGIEYSKCLVLEDAPKGVEAAQNAGMDCLVITTLHEEDEFSQYTNAVKFIKDYEGVSIL